MRDEKLKSNEINSSNIPNSQIETLFTAGKEFVSGRNTIDTIIINNVYYSFKSEIQFQNNKIIIAPTFGFYYSLKKNLFTCLFNFLFPNINTSFSLDDFNDFKNLISSCYVSQNKYFYTFFYNLKNKLYVGCSFIDKNMKEKDWESLVKRSCLKSEANFYSVFSSYVKHSDSISSKDDIYLFAEDVKTFDMMNFSDQCNKLFFSINVYQSFVFQQDPTEISTEQCDYLNNIHKSSYGRVSGAMKI